LDEVDEEVRRRIAGLHGVLRVVTLEPDDRAGLDQYGTAEAAENRGVAEVLSRQRALCLFKDASFRPPPEPTLLLVDEAGRTLGRELLPGEIPPADRRVAYLGKDFVLFSGERPQGQYRFLLPPVRFPELEAIPRVERVVSASPDTPQDDYLRNRFGVPAGHQYASVLIGYDVRNP
jgi:hypothetical protein